MTAVWLNLLFWPCFHGLLLTWSDGAIEQVT